MPKTKISEYSATANSNTDVASINIDEGCAPSGINNAIRAIMGHLKDFQSGTSNDPFTVGSSGSLTLSYGTANGVAYLNGSKVLTTGSALTYNGTGLGVGVASASFALDVGGADGTNIALRSTGTTAAKLRAYVNNAESAVIGFLNGGGQYFEVSGSEKMRISGATGGVGAVGIGYTSLTSVGDNGLAVLGNVGIGTSSPGAKLEVRDTNPTILLSNTASRYGYIQWENSGSQLRIGTDGAFNIRFDTNASQKMLLDTSGNLGLGVTPVSPVYAPARNLFIGQASTFIGRTTINYSSLGLNHYEEATTSVGKFINASSAAAQYYQYVGNHVWQSSTNTPTANGTIVWNSAMTLDASGNLLVGTTAAQLDGSSKMVVLNSSATVAEFTASSGTATQAVLRSWNTATSGDNLFQTFHTDAGATQRGSITYNRTAGLVAYNTTSDYRAKDISGPVNNSGALIDSVPVYMGTMKGAIQERPMFIAHEVPAYAHTGEKDAVDEDGNPVYQQMDASALIPVMWAEIQSLRKRLAAANL